jgi:3-methyl-2-oxobutanoate hydroxymethyltransferase
MQAIQDLMQAGAHAVKLEGAAGNEAVIRSATEAGIPVMGHLGLTPQQIHSLGGNKVQGRSEDSAKIIKAQALQLQEWGCFSLVLECIPSRLASEITDCLEIPSIGIGSGPDTDGQVLVFQDLLGLQKDFKLKFVKTYIDGYSLVKNAIDTYASDVIEGKFPLKDVHTFNEA